MAKTFEQLVPNAPEGRFEGISRPYGPAEVERLRGSVPIAYTLAERGANRLWQALSSEPYVNSLGAVTGNQAMQQARAGLPAIYLSGWQVCADRCRRRSRLRWSAQRVRNHEGLYRVGRGWRSLRGPARVRKEVRSHGRQGADPDRGA